MGLLRITRMRITAGKESAVTNDRMARWLGPLALGFLVSIALGFFIVGPTNSPGQNAPGAQVVTFYQNHSGRVWASLYIIGIGLALLTFFISGLRHALRDAAPNHRWLSTAAFAGGLIYIGGFGMAGMTHLILLEAAHNNRLDVAAQSNFIDQQFPVPVILGIFVATLATGVAILAGSALPAWLGWLSVVMAAAALAGPVAFIAFLAFPIWATIVGFMCPRAMTADVDATAPADAPGPVAMPRHRLIPRHHH
jgi:hypothetical protein